MDDESHSRLRIALESLLNQTTVGLRFSNAARFGSIASGLQIFGEKSPLHSPWRCAGHLSVIAWFRQLSLAPLLEEQREHCWCDTQQRSVFGSNIEISTNAPEV